MKKILALLIATVTVLMVSVAPAFAIDDICNSGEAKGLPNYEVLCGGGTEADLQANVQNILSTVFVWMGIISVIVIIIGGIKYMTSQGDPGKVKSAKDTILYAIIGLVVSVLAYAIVNFILRAVS